MYANQALLDLLGVTASALLNMPFLCHIAPEDRDRVRERHAARLRGAPVPDQYEFQIIGGDGARRTVEVWVSVDDDEHVIFQLYDRTARAARQAKLAGLARLGVAVQREQTEDAVFEAVCQGLVDFDTTMVWLAPNDDEPRLRIVHAAAPGGTVARFEAAFGRRLKGLHGRWGPETERTWNEGAAFVDDMPVAAARVPGRHAVRVWRARRCPGVASCCASTRRAPHPSFCF